MECAYTPRFYHTYSTAASAEKKDEMSLNLSFFNINHADVHQFYRKIKAAREASVVNDKKKMGCTSEMRSYTTVWGTVRCIVKAGLCYR